MENFILLLHLLIALALILTVLLQRSEGGGLGIGGGGGGGISGRPAASPVAKFTWWVAVAFIMTSLTLTWLGRNQATDDSIIDRLGIEAPSPEDAGDLLPPPPTTSEGLTLPPAVDDLLPPPPAQ